MAMCHRRFLQLAARSAALAAMSLAAMSGPAGAQAYPSRPVHWIVGAGAGSSPDIVARLVAPRLSVRLGQSVIVENRPGGGGNIATQAVVNAPPDGYSLLFVTNSQAINTTLYDNLPFVFIRDIVPVASLVRVPFVMIVNPSVPAKTLPEFIAYAKANPGKLTMASSGNGTVSHVAGELFKMMADVNMLSVPYRTGPLALTDLLGGHVHAMIDTVPSSIAYIKSGQLRALATVAPARSEELPDVPLITEFIPGYDASALFGVGVPKNTPPAIVERLSKEINVVLAEPELKTQFANVGLTVALSPAEYRNLIIEEIAKWAKVVKFSGAKPN